MNRVYICIDLKSFYASVECIARNLDPLDTNLVVADEERTDKTICLATSPSLKSYGIPSRSRLFEVKQKVKEINYQRKKNNHFKPFIGSSYINSKLKANPDLELDFIKAPPRMKLYMKYSTDIYKIYLKYISNEDILVYSIDEVFCDITNYLKYYNMTAEELTMKMITDVYNTTGITATAGIGTNMYLAKVAMDIMAKKMKPNKFGVRMASLNEQTYKKELWCHRPLTDFWRVGRGYAKKLEDNNLFTMGDIARTSLYNEDLLFKLFGVNAEFLIDHAWGYEPCTLMEAKEYKPKNSCISQGQVLHCAYDYNKARLIVQEMADSLTLDLVTKRLKTNQLVLTIGYDIENVSNPNIKDKYTGEIVIDMYGRKIPKHAHGTFNILEYTSSTTVIMSAIVDLFDKIVNPKLLIKRINLTACNLKQEQLLEDTKRLEQLDLFTDYKLKDIKRFKQKENEVKERQIQNTILSIKNKYGKNAILRGMNYEEGSTTRDRNNQVGGHKG